MPPVLLLPAYGLPTTGEPPTLSEGCHLYLIFVGHIKMEVLYYRYGGVEGHLQCMTNLVDYWNLNATTPTTINT